MQLARGGNRTTGEQLQSCAAGTGVNVTLAMSALLFGLWMALLLLGVLLKESARDLALNIVTMAISVAAAVGPLWTLGVFGFFGSGR